MIRLTTDQGSRIVEMAETIETLAQEKYPGQVPEEVTEVLQIAKQITEQLQSPAHAGDLVDTVAQILNELPSGAALGGMRLAQLRGAVLSPLELAKVKINTREMTCASCGVTLGEGSMMTQHRGQPRCVACFQPDSIDIQCMGQLGGQPHAKHIVLPDLVTKRLRTTVRKAPACEVCTPPTPVPVPLPTAAEVTADLRQHLQGRQIVVDENAAINWNTIQTAIMNTRPATLPNNVLPTFRPAPRTGRIPNPMANYHVNPTPRPRPYPADDNGD